MHVGHFHWASIARAIGKPLSSLRTLNGEEVYATYYFIEEHFPDHALVNTFKLDDKLRVAIFLRAFKNIAVEGRLFLDHEARLRGSIRGMEDTPPADAVACHPYIRFGNIFITPEAGNSRLKVAPPANADFSTLMGLPNEENPYHITKLAQQTGTLGLLDDAWRCVDTHQNFDVPYAIDPDRDSNGAGLVYFANYIAFMDFAERAAMRANSQHPFSDREIASRVVQRRRIAYYGNASLTDQIRIGVSVFICPQDNRRFGIRYAISRQEDGRLICLSEAVKVIP
jgi:probable biosynthetic protein (TIGR04098 family)